MNIEDMKTEMAIAKSNRNARGAFGSIIRRNYDEIKTMDTSQRAQFVEALGMRATFTEELRKELSVVKYDRENGFA